jgi:tetratricopeptide (TPR) repeat protein
LALALWGRLTVAEASFRDALRLDAGSAEAHFGLGSLLADRGEINAAIQHLREAVRLRPGFAPARDALAQALTLRRP